MAAHGKSSAWADTATAGGRPRPAKHPPNQEVILRLAAAAAGPGSPSSHTGPGREESPEWPLPQAGWGDGVQPPTPPSPSGANPGIGLQGTATASLLHKQQQQGVTMETPPQGLSVGARPNPPSQAVSSSLGWVDGGELLGWIEPATQWWCSRQDPQLLWAGTGNADPKVRLSAACPLASARQSLFSDPEAPPRPSGCPSVLSSTPQRPERRAGSKRPPEATYHSSSTSSKCRHPFWNDGPTCR